MTTKKEAQFSFEDCSCIEMMAQMLAQSQGHLGIDDACAEMMSQFIDPEGSGSEFFEMMSQMMASCCDIYQKDDEAIKKA